MHAFLDIQKKLVTNVSAHAFEPILWDLVTLRNILLELKLVKPEELSNKPVTYFQKVAGMASKVAQSDFKFESVKTIITELFPKVLVLAIELGQINLNQLH